MKMHMDMGDSGHEGRQAKQKILQELREYLMGAEMGELKEKMHPKPPPAPEPEVAEEPVAPEIQGDESELDPELLAKALEMMGIKGEE